MNSSTIVLESKYPYRCLVTYLLLSSLCLSGIARGQGFPWPQEGPVGFVAEFPHHTEIEAKGGHRCHSVAWAPDSHLLASGGADGTIVVRDIFTNQIVKQWKAANASVSSLHFSPKQNYLLSSDNDKGVRVWSLTNYEELGAKPPATHGIFLEEERVLASLRNSGFVGTWSPAATGQPRKLTDVGQTVFSLDVSNQAQVLATCSWKGTIQLRNLTDGTLIQEWPIAGRKVGLDSQGQRLLVGKDDEIRLLNRQEVESVWTRKKLTCCAAKFIQDDKVVLAGGWGDLRCVALDVERGRVIHSFDKAKAIGDLTVSPDRRFMATASTDGFVRVFRLPNGEQVKKNLDIVGQRAKSARDNAIRALGRNDLQGGLKHLDTAIDLDPGYAEAYFVRAQAKEVLGKQGNSQLLDEAAADYEMATRWDNDTWERHFKCAVFMSEVGKLESSDVHYRRTIALLLGPDNRLPKNPKELQHLAFSYLNNCVVLIRCNKLNEATEFGDKAVEAAPGIPMAQLNRGRAYHAVRDFGEALKSFKEALRLTQNTFRDAYLGLAYVYFDLGEIDKAYQSLTDAMRIQGAQLDQVRTYAELELLSGRYEYALAQLAPFEAFPQKRADTHVIAGRARAAAGDLEEAKEQFQEALKLEPNLPLAHLYLGDVQSHLGDKQAAKTSHKSALAQWTKQIQADDDAFKRNNRGSFYLRYGKVAEARDDFAAATKLEQRHFWSMGNLSYTYSAAPNAEERDGKEALKIAEAACDITLHRNGWCLSVKAAALAELGRFDEAIAVQQKAVELCGNHEVIDYRERLRLYEQKKPFRFPARGDQESWLRLQEIVVPSEEVPVKTLDCLKGKRPVKELDAKTVAKQQDAVVLIKSESGFGTGMIVDRRGYVLTCAHVLPYAGKANVHYVSAGGEGAGNLVAEAEVIAADHRNDLALLKFTPPKDNQLAHVRLGLNADVNAAEEVVIVGNPGVRGFVLQKSVLLGLVSNKRQQVGEFVKRPHVQLAADVVPGCSGGPVFNLWGEVIGVVDQNAPIARTGFAIPMDAVKNFLGL